MKSITGVTSSDVLYGVISSTFQNGIVGQPIVSFAFFSTN
jgi:hypothetical protein